MNRVRRCF